MTHIQQIKTWLIASIFIAVPFIYSPTLKDHTLGPKLFTWQIILLGILILWFVAKEGSFYLPKLAIPALVYTATTLVTSPFATHPDVAYLETSKVVSGLIFFLILCNHLTHQNIPKILSVCIGAGIIVALLGMCDYLGWRPFRIPSAGLPSATLGFRNIAAMYMIQALPFAFALFVTTTKHHKVALTATALTLMGAFLVYTRSRGAWLGFGVASLTTAILWYYLPPTNILPILNRQKQKYIGIASVVFILFITLPSGMQKQGPQSIDEKKTTIGQTIQSATQAGGDRGRLTVWRNTLPLIATHPIWGIGLGNWAVHYPIYDKGTHITFNSAPERPHNTFLSIWAELGSIGLISYLWLCIATIRLGVRQLQNSQTRWVAAAGLASFIAILTHSFFSFPNERITPTLFFWFVPALFVALHPSKKPFPHKLSKGILGILLVITALQLALTWRVIQFDSWLFQATQSERVGNWSAVATQTEKALSYGEFHSEAFILRGYALNTLGDYTTSLSHYQYAIQKRPYDLQLLNGLAISAQSLQQYELAHQTYLKALQIVDSADTRYNLAGLLLLSGHAEDAAKQYTHVLQIEQPSLDLYYHLSLAYFLAHASQKAQKVLQQAFALVPNHAQAHFEWIETLYNRHRKPALASVYYQTFIQFWQGTSQDLEQAQKRLNELQQMKP
ncbi:MAG: O-antigen ligase family protein [Candidatus Latescibacterota bacterium]